VLRRPVETTTHNGHSTAWTQRRKTGAEGTVR